MKTKNTKILITLASITIIGMLLFSGQTFGVKDQAQISQETEKIELEYWRVTFDTPDGFEEVIDAFESANPNVSVNLKTFSYENYEKELINALAAGKGPDAFSYHNDELPKYIDKLYPMPASYTKIETSGQMCKSEKVVEYPFYNARTFQETFADVATQDLVYEGYVMGVPLYIDTLALFYNKPLLNTAGVKSPPTTWTEFNEAVKLLTQRSQTGAILKPGAAMGTAENISRSPDILQLLMLQNGTEMTSADDKTVVFDKSIVTDQGTYYPGSASLEFYTDFANPDKSVYTWDRRQNFSIDAFASGELAMMLHYSYQIPLIKEKSPNLDFNVAKAPQIEGNDVEINYPNYFAEGVSKQSEHPEEAWELLYYMTQKEPAMELLSAIKKPTARKDLISAQSEMEVDGIFLKPFVDQVLTAKSWYKINNSLVEQQFAEMIENVNLGKYDPEEAVERAAAAINALMPAELPTLSEEFLPQEEE